MGVPYSEVTNVVQVEVSLMEQCTLGGFVSGSS